MKKHEEREMITLENQGQRIFGVIHRPLVVEPCPAIFLCHGFAGNKCGRHRMYVNLAKELSRLGILTMRIDFRGSGDSEGELSDMTLEDEVDDALLGLRYLESLPYINPKRIGIIGRSLGGAVAVISAKRFSKAKSLALWAPVFHANQWKEEWARAKEKLLRHESLEKAMRFNGHVAGKEFVKQLFEMRLGQELESLHETPLLHIHGEKDAMVKIEHADHYKESRLKSSALSRFVSVPHGDHDFTLPEAQEHAIRETCQWFKETL